jgi:hypothetical protein
VTVETAEVLRTLEVVKSLSLSTVQRLPVALVVIGAVNVVGGVGIPITSAAKVHDDDVAVSRSLDARVSHKALPSSIATACRYVPARGALPKSA